MIAFSFFQYSICFLEKYIVHNVNQISSYMWLKLEAFSFLIEL